MKTRLFTGIGAALIILASTACSNNSTPPTQAASYRIAASMFGLESGKPYPLETGDKIAGSEGSASAQAGLFYSSAHASLVPASAITVIFRNGNRQWNLEIPTSKITFVINDSAQETVVLKMSTARTYRVLSPVEGGPDADDICNNKSAHECGAMFSPYGDGETQGLAPIVQEGLVGAIFTVSQATADQLSGRK